MKIRLYKLLFASIIIAASACKKDDSYEPLIDEPTFTNQVIGTTERLTRVQFINENVGFVSGQKGTLLTTINAGETWTKQTVGTTENLQSVNFIDNLIGWTAGAKGLIYKTTDGGVTWTKQTLPTTTETMNSVKFADVNNGWVVGAKGLIYNTKDGGVTWSQQVNFDTLGMRAGVVQNVIKDAGTVNANQGNIVTTTLNQVFIVDANNLYIIAGNGVVLKTVDAGATWKWINTYNSNNLLGISAYSGNDITVCGANGAGLKIATNGTIVDITNKSNTRNCRDVCFTTSNNGWAIGDHGYIFKTTNSGAYWGNELKSDLVYTLYSCVFTSKTTGYFVGNNGAIVKVKDID